MQTDFNHYYFKSNKFKPEKVLANEKKDQVEPDSNKKLFCNFCKNLITNEDEAISVEDSHTHTFSNPAGYIYTISCYQTAPGCAVVGEKTTDYSWFTGYAWQLALCHSCHEQLGWQFSNGQQFYALISDRLTQE
jgi:hypothetical protein